MAEKTVDEADEELKHRPLEVSDQVRGKPGDVEEPEHIHHVGERRGAV